eukprot:363865-Chlamydomonas_euryale.AAC.6
MTASGCLQTARCCRTSDVSETHGSERACGCLWTCGVAELSLDGVLGHLKEPEMQATWKRLDS